MSGWHSSKLKEVLDRLRTERIGLRQKEAEARLLKYDGPGQQDFSKLRKREGWCSQKKSGGKLSLSLNLFGLILRES